MTPAAVEAKGEDKIGAEEKQAPPATICVANGEQGNGIDVEHSDGEEENDPAEGGTGGSYDFLRVGGSLLLPSEITND